MDCGGSPEAFAGGPRESSLFSSFPVEDRHSWDLTSSCFASFCFCSIFGVLGAELLLLPTKCVPSTELNAWSKTKSKSGAYANGSLRYQLYL